jgi:endonuclease-3
MHEAAIEQLFERLASANPEPKTELNYGSPFELLIAVILSAQATDVSINRVTPALFARAPTAAAMVALGERRIRTLVKSIGLYKTKARNIVRAARILVERHDGAVPRDRAALEALPGVGRKTANVVLNTAFGEPTIAVDTHVFRVANRTGLARGRTPRAVEDKLLARVPPRFRHDAHHWLILHGRYTCTARRPRCGECPIAAWCEWRGRGVGPPGETGSGVRRARPRAERDDR